MVVQIASIVLEERSKMLKPPFELSDYGYQRFPPLVRQQDAMVLYISAQVQYFSSILLIFLLTCAKNEFL